MSDSTEKPELDLYSVWCQCAWNDTFGVSARRTVHATHASHAVKQAVTFLGTRGRMVESVVLVNRFDKGVLESVPASEWMDAATETVRAMMR